MGLDSTVRTSLVLIVTLATSMLPGYTGDDTPPAIPSAEERARVLIDSKSQFTSPEPPGEGRRATLAAQDDFDVTSYLIDLYFDDVNKIVSGWVTMTATSLADGLQVVPLDLLDNMNVSGVWRSGTVVSFTHTEDVLNITLDQAFDEGQSFEVRIHYAGSPQSGGFGTFGWNKYITSGEGQMVWSLSEPEGARHWWPCKDRPDDKAMVEEWWTVRSDWTATGNGVLLGVDPMLGDRSRYRWRSSHPLTTYLVSIAATDYVGFSDTYTPLDGGSMPIEHYVYPDDLDEAQVSFTATSDMIRFYAETFGEYPFVADKYGMSAFPFWGAMEHTANTSYGYPLIDGTHTYDWVVAHEIAHQWFGDSLSPRTWADIWLNEGFASHLEALWVEHLGGTDSYHAYMDSMYRSYFDGPLYDPNELFGLTVYNKGAWIQHMLRGVLGDEDFFLSQRAWYDENKDGVVDTARYQATLEQYYGDDLDWFFEPWVYGANMPEYQYGFSSADLGDGTYRNYIRIHQVQTDAGVFTMPVELTLVNPNVGQPHVAWNNGVDQDFVVETDDPLIDVVFDPSNWILKSSADEVTLPDGDSDGVPDRNDNCPMTANPTQADFDEDLLGDACDDDDDGDLLDDAFDCAPLDGEQGLPAEVTGLTLDREESDAWLSWTAADRADTYDLTRGLLNELSLTYGVCLETDLTDLSAVDAEVPPSGDGFQYLVRGYDSGCGGAGSMGQDSTGAPRPSPCP